MMTLIFGIAIGLIVGWNLLPQPAIVKRGYTKAFNWLTSTIAVMILMLTGCGIGAAGTGDDIGFAKERAIAEIAIASETAGRSPSGPAKPKVGDKCPDCNSPPGDCGVGQVGDGNRCDTCGLCNGDGMIDSRDLTGKSIIPVPVPDPLPDQVEVPREVVLHTTLSLQTGWPSRWYREKREAFIERGWKVKVVIDDEADTKSSYFNVIDAYGDITPFFTPIEPEDIRHLETK